MNRDTTSTGDGGRDRPKPLPLSPPVFDILLVLSDGDEHHGYGIAREVELRTGGEVKLGPGILYGAIKRMISQGLIVESGEREAEQRKAASHVARGHQDGRQGRRRYYRITESGRQTAAAEAQRLQSLVNAARDRGLLRGPGTMPEEI